MGRQNAAGATVVGLLVILLAIGLATPAPSAGSSTQSTNTTEGATAQAETLACDQQAAVLNWLAGMGLGADAVRFHDFVLNLPEDRAAGSFTDYRIQTRPQLLSYLNSDSRNARVAREYVTNSLFQEVSLQEYAQVIDRSGKFKHVDNYVQVQFNTGVGLDGNSLTDGSSVIFNGQIRIVDAGDIAWVYVSSETCEVVTGTFIRADCGNPGITRIVPPPKSDTTTTTLTTTTTAPEAEEVKVKLEVVCRTDGVTEWFATATRVSGDEDIQVFSDPSGWTRVSGSDTNAAWTKPVTGVETGTSLTVRWETASFSGQQSASTSEVCGTPPSTTTTTADTTTTTEATTTTTEATTTTTMGTTTTTHVFTCPVITSGGREIQTVPRPGVENPTSIADCIKPSESGPDDDPNEPNQPDPTDPPTNTTVDTGPTPSAPTTPPTTTSTTVPPDDLPDGGEPPEDDGPPATGDPGTPP